MLQSTKKSLRDLITDCCILALAAYLLAGCIGCGDYAAPKWPLVDSNSLAPDKTGVVVEMDLETVPDFAILRVRTGVNDLSDVGAIAPVSEGIELGDVVQLYWTSVFNHHGSPSSGNQFRRATKVPPVNSNF